MLYVAVTCTVLFAICCSAGEYNATLYSGHVQGCLHYFDIVISIDGSGSLNINSSRKYPSDHYPVVGSVEKNDHYLFVNITGGNSLQSSIVTNDVAFHDLLPICISHPGSYNVSFSLLYNTSMSAYALQDWQEAENGCELLSELGKPITLTVPWSFFNSMKVSQSRILPSWTLAQNSMHSEKGLYKYRVGKHYISPYDGKLVHASALQACICRRRIVLLGDSHTAVVHELMKRLGINCHVIFREDGKGVMHNISPDIDMNAYVRGELPAKYVQGSMLENLESGLYSSFVHVNGSKTFIIQTGHWDLRDTDIDKYKSNMKLLISKWVEFRKLHHIKLIWFGVPAYSFHRPMWGGMEKRTNIKLALADNYMKSLCKSYHIPHISFFDISFPFYKESCDTHHYVCPFTNLSTGTSFVGLEHLNSIFNALC